MPFELSLTPQGHILPLYDGTDAEWGDRLRSRFADDEAAGLVALAAMTLPPMVSPSVLFWREVAAEFVRTLCHLPDDIVPDRESLPPPSDAMRAEWTLNAPPMPGAEYLSPAVLAAIWDRLAQWTLRQIAEMPSPAAFLNAYAPQWTRVGRISLHLAENKQDAEYPFAFMATYAAGISRGGRLRRLPLGNALREYAGANRRPELLKLLAPIHAAAQRSPAMAEWIESGDIFHPLVWTPAEAYAFLKDVPLYQECGLLTELPDWWRKRPRPRVQVTLDGGKGKRSTLGTEALLQFQIELVLGEQRLSPDEIEALMQNHQALVQLRGQWVEVDGEKLREALDHWKRVERQAGTDGISFLQGMRLLAGAPADLNVGNEPEAVTQHWSTVAAGGRLRTMLDQLRNPASLDEAPPTSFRGQLRHYQHAGLNWLWFCKQLGLGACLADDMGLGKTIQILAALLRQRQCAKPESTRSPALLVAPASLLGNWKAEAERFAPDLTLWIAHPSESSGESLDAVEKDPRSMLNAIDLVITTYGMVPRLTWLHQVDWHWLILDEAQAIKNPSARQTRAVKKIPAAARTVLTGTPVENRLGDLWSIFDFINPGLLGTATTFKTFTKRLGAQGHAEYAPLRKLVAPYILRRMKTDPTIAPELPAKTEMQVYCGLSAPQAALYQQSVIALRRALEATDVSPMRRRGLVLSFLMRFKQICNHPSQLSGDGVYAPEASAKFQRLESLCGEIHSRGEKALIFTQFRELTDPLAQFLSGVFGREGLILHGGTPVKKRKVFVDAFQRTDGPPFFLLSLKAGGTGLNLTAASHVVHFDRWWNPAVENQATDRAFRIGQTRSVLVHKFVTRGTVEEKIDTMIREKQQLADALLGDGSEKVMTEMTNDEILKLVALDIERARN